MYLMEPLVTAVWVSPRGRTSW